VNENVPEFIITKVVKKLIEQGNIISQSNVVILGASFKENCGDYRNSKVQDMYNSFLEYSINTEIYDPLINSDLYYKTHGVKLIEDLKLHDAIIIAVPHETILNLNVELLKKKNNSIIFDVKGAFDKNEYFQL
jgi:UDP-N-acetyl-D-galactosamine dehydrogenase